VSDATLVAQGGGKEILASRDDLLAEIDLASETFRKLRQRVEVAFHAKQLEASLHASGTDKARKLGCQDVWVGALKYDWARDTLVLPSGTPHALPKRCVEVLRLLLTKDPGNPKARRLFASVTEVGLLYRAAQLREICPTIDEKTFKERLQTISDDKITLKKHAHQCKRSLARWARGIGIDGDLLLECKRGQDTYHLGKGWHQKTPVVNQSQVYAAKEFKDSVLHGELNTQPDSTEEVSEGDDQNSGHNDASDPIDGSVGEDS